MPPSTWLTDCILFFFTFSTWPYRNHTSQNDNVEKRDTGFVRLELKHALMALTIDILVKSSKGKIRRHLGLTQYDFCQGRHIFLYYPSKCLHIEKWNMILKACMLHDVLRSNSKSVKNNTMEIIIVEHLYVCYLLITKNIDFSFSPSSWIIYLEKCTVNLVFENYSRRLSVIGT